MTTTPTPAEPRPTDEQLMAMGNAYYCAIVDGGGTEGACAAMRKILGAAAADPVTQLLAEMRSLAAETLARPGVAVKMPPLVANEGRKFMRGEPSLFDRIPIGDLQSLDAVAPAAAEIAQPATPEPAADAVSRFHA